MKVSNPMQELWCQVC